MRYFFEARTTENQQKWKGRAKRVSRACLSRGVSWGVSAARAARPARMTARTRRGARMPSPGSCRRTSKFIGPLTGFFCLVSSNFDALLLHRQSVSRCNTSLPPLRPLPPRPSTVRVIIARHRKRIAWGVRKREGNFWRLFRSRRSAEV